jgi:hypothetical protein
MKILHLLIIACILFAGCKKEDNADDADRIEIRGTLVSGSKGSSSVKGFSANLLDATKVLIFYGNRYDLAEISNGTFSVNAETGKPTALVFLDASNNFIGNLFAGGLNMLPLGNIDGSATVIDLQNLTLTGTTVIPSHDPIGDEIDITSEEATRFRELGGYYEFLAKNIDADNDGVPDILNKKDLRISSRFEVYGGSWGLNTTQPSEFDISGLRINYSVRIEGNISMSPSNSNTVALSGPVDSPYSDIVKERFQADKDCFITFFSRPGELLHNSPIVNNLLPFKKGIYSFTLDGSTDYTLNYSNINAGYFLVIASPTLHTDNEGRITSVTINYKLPDNTIVDPENFVTILQLMFRNKDGSRVEIGALYESVQSRITLKDLTNITIENPFPLSNLNELSVNYNDMLGNEYNILWK